LAVDAQARLLELCLGAGEEHDFTRAEELPAEHEPKSVIAAKAMTPTSYCKGFAIAVARP
jgi:hypothetical protein